MAGWKVILVGDFNAHVGGIVRGNRDRMNGSRRCLIRLVEDDGWVMVNGSSKCTGTWKRMLKEWWTVIDYVICSRAAFQLLEDCIIDEDGNQCEVSDHNWLFLRMGGRGSTSI